MLLRLLLVAGAAVLIALLGWPADRMASSALLAARSPLVLLKSTGRHLARSSPFLRPFATSRPMSAALSYPPTRRDEDKVLEFQSKEDGRVEIKDRECAASAVPPPPLRPSAVPAASLSLSES